MKNIRNLMMLSGLLLGLFALAVTGARAQGFSSTSFEGTFALPVQTQWGAMFLPAGEYTLRYGMPFKGGTYLVTIDGKAKGSPRGMILPGPRDDVKGAENVLDCVREGNTLYVRALELPAIGESIHFRIPHVVQVRSKVIAKNHNQSGKAQFAEVAIRVERTPVK